MTEEIKHIDEYSQEYIAKGNRMTEEIKDETYFRLKEEYLSELQRLKQENELLKDKCKLLQKTVDNECALCKNDLLCERLEKQDKYRSALEEIREILNKSCGVISNAKAVGIINEVLGT